MRTELRLAHETENMLLNAEMKLRASLSRTESRGTHYREDYPARDDDELAGLGAASNGFERSNGCNQERNPR